MLIGMPATLSVAERAVVPVFAAIMYVADPDPVPEPVNVIHAAAVDDVQAQADCVDTVIVPLPPPGGRVTMRGVTANVHDALGSVTMKVLPAIVSVAVRGEVVVLAVAVKRTLPGPVPVAPLPIVTHPV